MKNNTYELIKQELQKLAFSIEDITSIYIFGSYAKETATEKSDLDVAIICRNNTSYELVNHSLSELTKKYKIFIHPVIFDKPKNQLINNNYIKTNIFDNSIIIYSIE